jgi:N-acetylmuramoyl-L-alanine amidase
MSFQITHDYIKHGNARPGDPLVGPLFGVAHDIGNGGSTARQNRSHFNNNQPSASAHVFIDDIEILVIIPLNEKAWHVQYQKTLDNLRFGEDANDAAIGVELCWGGKINFAEAYKRYVWFWAWLCKKHNWNPHEKIASHKQLDPERRTDPDNALNKHGITWLQFLDDVKKELDRMSAPVVKQAVKRPADSADGRLTRGECGPNVKILIDMLRELEHTKKTDDFFDQYIERALMEFQVAHGLKPDGVYTSAIGKVMVQAIKEKEPDYVYKVQIGAFGKEENAKAAAAQAEKLGLKTYIEREEK